MPHAAPEPHHTPESDLVHVTGMPRYLAEGTIGQPVRMRRTLGDIPAGTLGTVLDIGPGDHDTIGVLIVGWHIPGAEEPITRWMGTEEYGWWVEETDADGQPLSAAQQAEEKAILFVNAMQQRLSTIDALLDALQYLGTAASPRTLGNLLYVAEEKLGEAHGVVRQWLCYKREEAGGVASWRQPPAPVGEMAS